MVIAGLLLVVVVSVVVARAGLAYLDGAPRHRTTGPVRDVRASAAPTIDLRDAGTAPSASPRAWMLRDFDVQESDEWIRLGFDPDHAFLFRSLAIDATTAARLRNGGLEDAALVALIEEASFGGPEGREQLVALAERAPQLAPQALAWMRLGTTAERALAYATEGFTPAEADLWRAVDWELDDALPWFAARFEPASAREWREHGFAPEPAAAWRREHFGVRQAVQWRRLGDTPAQARSVAQQFVVARVTVTEGLHWLDLGFSVDEICSGWPAMAAGHDARAWRAGWKALPLSPAEVAAWHAEFDRDETMRWLDAGVRDASAAIRLRARGFGPDDVASVVGDRLADTFDAVPVTRDDLLSAAGQLARAGGSAELRLRLERATAVNGDGDPKEVAPDLIEDVLDELQRLSELGLLGAPHTARALARQLERGLIASALVSGRHGVAEAPRAS